VRNYQREASQHSEKRAPVRPHATFAYLISAPGYTSLMQGRNQLIFSVWRRKMIHNLLLYLTTKYVFEKISDGDNCPLPLLAAGLL